MTLPMVLTWTRVVLIPVCVLAFYLPVSWARAAAAGIFVLAAITDWLDGYLARRWQQTSAFGAFLDPVADKLMVAVVLVLVVHASAQESPGLISRLIAVSAMAIIARELLVSGLREWMASIGAREQVAVSWTGKVKTAAQMIALALLLYGDTLFGVEIRIIGMLGLLLATALAYLSLAGYVAAVRRVVRAETAENRSRGA